MKHKKLFGIFDTRPMIWFHYILLTSVLFGAFFTANYVGFVDMTSTLSSGEWVLLYLWYFVFISIGDQLIHYIIGVD